MQNKVGKKNNLFKLILCFVVCFCVFVPNVFADVIIDNDGPGTSFSGGSWDFSSGANPYGINSRAENHSGATYTFQGAATGYQEVSLWWTYWSSRCTAVPVDIYDGSTLLDTVYVNQHQQDLAGKWNVLGSYSFSGTARVVIRAQSGCSACADAVKLASYAPPVMVDVPDVVGLPQGNAETMITGADLLVGNVTMASSNTVPEGNVISQTPTGGTSVPEGSAVALVVSTGEPSGADVIIDNDGPGTSFSGGSWDFSSGANPYGINSRAENHSGATYTFQGAATGYQEVSLWWTYWSSRCTAVPVDIYDGSTLLDTVYVNQHQQDLAGKWNVLGSYSFSGTARVVVRAQGGCSACADAVKLASYAPPVMVDVPDVVGLPQGNAETMITGADLLVGNVTMASSNTVPEGNVISQTPTGGTSVPEGSAVALVVSTGEPSGADVIIDNDGPGTSFSGGSWSYSSGANPYGINSRAENHSGATYTFQGAATGYQEVSLWWTWWSSRCTAVPVDIYDGTTLLNTVEVNQQQENQAGRWNLLGSYPFSGTARVVIRAQSGCSACADAVKLASSTAPVLSRVRIEGPDAVRENTSNDYNLRAYYTDGTDKLKEADSWSVDCPAHANISATGLFSSNEVTADVPCKITANFTEGGILKADSNDIFIKNIVHGNILRHKFTVNLPGGGQIQPVMGDIDGDGVQEIVMAVDSDNIVAINGKTGAIKWSVPGSNHAVELADLNKDGIPEILFGIERRGSTGPRVRALRGDGTTLWTSPELHGDEISGFPIATADIDGDGYPEIYFETEDTNPDPYSGNIGDYNGALFMLDHNGHVLRETWVWHPCWGGMAIGDANNDGVFEVYVNDRRAGYHGMTESQGIQAFNAHTLEFLWGRPDIQHSSPHPVLADVLGDSNLEVVATEITLKGPHVLDPEDGHDILDYSNRNLPTHGTPTVYDIDHDGHLEYIVSTSYPSNAPKKFVVFDLISGTVDFESYFDYRLAWSPSVGDVTGDGFMEILAATGDQLEEVGDSHNGSYPLVVYDKNFNTIDWIDMPQGTGQLTAARVFDTDGDGYNEVVVAGFYGKLMVYDTNARTPNPAPRSWVQFYSEYRRNAAEYVPPPGH